MMERKVTNKIIVNQGCGNGEKSGLKNLYVVESAATARAPYNGRSLIVFEHTAPIKRPAVAMVMVIARYSPSVLPSIALIRGINMMNFAKKEAAI